MACCTTVAMASYHKCSHFIIIDIMELQELQGNVSFNRILASYRCELWTKPFFTPIIRSRKLYFFRRRKRDFFKGVKRWGVWVECFVPLTDFMKKVISLGFSNSDHAMILFPSSLGLCQEKS